MSANGPPVRPTVGKVVHTPLSPPRKLKGLNAKDIAGNCSSSDFFKWLDNFGVQDSGHFKDYESCVEFATLVKAKIDEFGKVTSGMKEFAKWLIDAAFQHKGLFVGEGAAMHLVRQIHNYLDIDGYIQGEQNDKTDSGTPSKADGVKTTGSGTRRRGGKQPPEKDAGVPG